MAIKKLSLKRSRRTDARRSKRLETSRGGSKAGVSTLHALPGGKRRVRRRQEEEAALWPRRRARPVPPES